MESKLATSGFMSYFEKLIRAHPLIYIFLRSMVRFTNIFEKDFDGVKLLKFNEKVNIIDVGASDGIATKFLSKHLNYKSILCFEPNPQYVKILKKIKIKNVIVKPFGISDKNCYVDILYPRYKFFKKNYDIISYTGYGGRAGSPESKFMNHMLLDFKFNKNISVFKKKIAVKKIKK